jgi:hypothetical protein
MPLAVAILLPAGMLLMGLASAILAIFTGRTETHADSESGLEESWEMTNS